MRKETGLIILDLVSCNLTIGNTRCGRYLHHIYACDRKHHEVFFTFFKWKCSSKTTVWAPQTCSQLQWAESTPDYCHMMSSAYLLYFSPSLQQARALLPSRRDHGEHHAGQSGVSTRRIQCDVDVS